jgi:Cu+-exporting ATPase
VRRRFWTSAALTAVLSLLTATDLIPASDRQRLWGALLLATPVVVWGAGRFFVRALRALLRVAPDAFTLTSLAVLLAYAAAAAAVILPSQLASEVSRDVGQIQSLLRASAVIVTLALFLRVHELRARHRSGAPLRALLELIPPVVLRLRDDGVEEKVHTGLVRPGDRLRVPRGQRVPVDGTMLEGRTAVLESVVSGDPITLEKGPGSPLVAGTLNGASPLVMRADRVGDETLLARLGRMGSVAQRGRAPLARRAEVVAAGVVLGAMVVSVAAFLSGAMEGPVLHALERAVAVMTCASPAALVVAAPTALVIAMGRAARVGVLFSDGEALEALSRVDTLVVGKTGLITEGVPNLVSVLAVAGVDSREVLRLAAAVEHSSRHALAEAIIAGAQVREIPVGEAQEFSVVPGQGVRGIVEGRPVLVGNQRLMAGAGVEVGALAAPAESLRGDGQTAVLVAVEGRVVGVLGLSDPVKPTTPEALRALRAAGLRVVLLTGDSRAAANALAARLGIDQVIADVSPAQRAEAVASLQQDGRRVAVAGEWGDDAAAIAQAHVGISLGTGSDAVVGGAAVTLVRRDLRAIVRARQVSQATLANIKQSIVFALAYNLLSAPLAAGFLLEGHRPSPELAAAAMVMSSLVVIANARRLGRI